MKLLLLALFLSPMTVFALESHREATTAERKAIFSNIDEERLKSFGEEKSREVERNILNDALLIQAIFNEKLDETQMKGYIQKLTDQGFSSEEIKQEIDNLSKRYSTELQFKEIEDSQRVEQFKNSFLLVAVNNTFVKSPVESTQNQIEVFKIMVPNEFSLSSEKGDEKEGKRFIHQIYVAWGWNRDYHSNTDVKFTTADGTFTVHDTHAVDRPSPFDPNIYFNPATLSIPQYNLEIGVMLNEKWGIEIKQDHMKLIFDNSKPYEITGDYSHKVVIPNDQSTNIWDQLIPVDFSVAKAKKDATWLNFEHSDGYNYVSAGAVYNQNLYKTKNSKFKIDSRFGAGAGLMIPKTKVMMHQDRVWNWEGLDNKFHVAGGGVHAETKLRFTFWNSFYLQASTRGTYIKVKDALVDGSDSRMEHIQPIASVQFMGQFGFTHTFKDKKKKTINTH